MLHVPDSDATYARAIDMGATALRPDRRGLRRAAAARSAIRSDTAGSCRPRSSPTTSRSKTFAGRRYGDIGYSRSLVADGDRAHASSAICSAGDPEPGYQAGAFHIVVDHSAGRDRRRPGKPGDPALLPRRRHRSGRRRGCAISAGRCCRSRDYESGGNAECVDDQGLRFDLFRPKPGY